MCGPLALGIAQGGLSLIGSAAAVSEQNAASARNRQHAILAMNDENAQATNKYLEDNRSLIQGGFDSILAGRANEATAYTSALQNGVSGASVKAVLRDHRQLMGRNKGRTQQEVASLRQSTSDNFKNIRSRTQGRINQVPTTSLNVGDFASALSPIMRAAAG